MENIFPNLFGNEGAINSMEELVGGYNEFQGSRGDYLSMVFDYQFATLKCNINDTKLRAIYKNELETIQYLNTIFGPTSKPGQGLWLSLLEEKPLGKQITDMVSESNRLREEGNKVYNLSAEKRNLLAAARYYTDAIYAAPTHSLALALAYANRAMALQECGHYLQAYDDCQCAIEQGYPKKLMQKVLARQAFCAWKLGDAVKLKLHLSALQMMDLNANFTAQVRHLQSKLALLVSGNAEKPVKPEDKHDIHLDKGASDVLKSPEGYRLIAKRDINEGEVIFRERARSFISKGDWRICQNCAAFNIIPIPCHHCRSTFCSVKCRNARADIHAYECAAIRMGITKFLNGPIFLSCRMVLDGLPTIIPLLRNKLDAKEIYAQLIGDGSIAQSNTIEYAEALRVSTNFDDQTLGELTFGGIYALFIVTYLRTKTTFFDLVKDSAASFCDWTTITAALILRHFGQLYYGTNLGHTILVNGSKPTDCILLMDNLWSRPFHVQRGVLHRFDLSEDVAVVNFPYLAKCNHACESSFEMKISGNYLCAYATKPIKNGEEIYVSQTPSYRRSTSEERHKLLKDQNKVMCKCSKCQRPNADQDWNIFHRYRCDNLDCRRVFVSPLNKWNEYVKMPIFHCSFCGARQKLAWLQKLLKLLSRAENAITRRLVYKYFESLDNWLIGKNHLKSHVALHVFKLCFAICKDDSFTQTDVLELERLLKFRLRIIAEEYGHFSITHAVQITYLWDLIATAKIKCKPDEMQEMLKVVEIFDDDIKRIFINYYDDYIKHLVL